MFSLTNDIIKINMSRYGSRHTRPTRQERHINDDYYNIIEMMMLLLLCGDIKSFDITWNAITHFYYNIKKRKNNINTRETTWDLTIIILCFLLEREKEKQNPSLKDIMMKFYRNSYWFGAYPAKVSFTSWNDIPPPPLSRLLLLLSN